MRSNEQELEIPLGDLVLPGTLMIPGNAKGIIVFAHASGRHNSGSRYLASALENAGFATLLFDLLTDAEDRDAANRFDIDLLTKRLIAATEWLQSENAGGGMATGYLAAGTGSAAALKAASPLGYLVAAVVSVGGRPDLAFPMLSSVVSPTMLIAGRLDPKGIEFNERALAEMRAERAIRIVEDAGSLFEDEGTLEEVARLALSWFTKYIVTKVD
ncbi:MAG TPA: hypothetical protein VD772_02595 [Anseongella sp.]|nr:hypothetical protein [Anseongella sp.]